MNPVTDISLQAGIDLYRQNPPCFLFNPPDIGPSSSTKSLQILGNGAFDPPEKKQPTESVCSDCKKKSLLKLFILKGIAISLVNFLAQEVEGSNLLDPHSHLYHLILFLYSDLINDTGEDIEALPIDDSWYEDLPQPFLAGLLELYDELLNSTTGYQLLLQWY